MTVHSASSSIELDSGILLAAPGVKNGASAQSDLHFFLNANWISSESNLLVTVSASATVYPPLTFLNSEGNVISKIMFESIYPGHKTETQTITAVNKTDSTLTVILSAIEGISQSGYEVDTYGSLRFSDDDDIYYETLTLEIPSNDSLDFYIYYNPPSTAKIGEKEWAINVLPSSLPEWLYYDTFTVTNNADEQITDTIIYVTVPYAAGKIETDFQDIRFHTEAEELESSIDHKVDSSYAVFTVRIPVLDEDEIIQVYVYGGNTYADDNDDNVFTENWNWEDGVYGWTTTQSGPHSYVSIVAWSDWDYAMRLAAGSSWAVANEVESTGAYGKWTMKYQFKVGISSVFWHTAKWYFIRDGTNYYNITIDNYAQTITLYKNSTVLDSTSFARNLNVRLLEVERDLDGNFSVSVDGTELLTATDNTITASSKEALYFAPSGITERHWYIDYIHFVEYEVVPPTVGSFTGWENRLDLECYGGILYVSRELPELEPEISYRCKIEETYYE